MADPPDRAKPELVAVDAIKSDSEDNMDNLSTAPKVVEFTLCNPGVSAGTLQQLGREELVMSQRAYPSLAKCFAAIKPKNELPSVPVGFYMEGDA